MEVTLTYTNDPQNPLTSPFPAPGKRFLVRLMVGDVCDPYLDPDGWFGPKKPLFVLRYKARIPLPYLAYRFGNRAGYIGWKCYGVDSESYKAWIESKEVCPGSQALCLTCRPFATLKESV